MVVGLGRHILVLVLQVMVDPLDDGLDFAALELLQRIEFFKYGYRHQDPGGCKFLQFFANEMHPVEVIYEEIRVYDYSDIVE